MLPVWIRYKNPRIGGYLPLFALRRDDVPRRRPQITADVVEVEVIAWAGSFYSV